VLRPHHAGEGCSAPGLGTVAMDLVVDAKGGPP
jgi:hypothetical protein